MWQNRFIRRLALQSEFEINYPLHKNRIFILNPHEEELIKKFLIEKLGDEIQYEVYTDNSERHAKLSISIPLITLVLMLKLLSIILPTLIPLKFFYKMF